MSYRLCPLSGKERNDDSSHRGINLSLLVMKNLALIVLCGLISTCESNVREQQARFYPGLVVTGRGFALRQLLETRCMCLPDNRTSSPPQRSLRLNRPNSTIL